MVAPFSRLAGPHPSYPLNETAYSADLDAYFIVWPARARAGAAAGAFELYLLAGAGILATRPIAVVDPADCDFEDNRLAGFTLGAGARLFSGERVAVTLELRDSVYFEKIENREVPDGSSSPPTFADDPRNPATFYDPAPTPRTPSSSASG